MVKFFDDLTAREIFADSFSAKNSWIEDNFHYETKQGRNEPLPQTGFHVSSSVTAKKILFSQIVVGFLFIVILARIFALQLLGGKEYRSLAEGNSQRIVPIPAERGLVYDRRMIELTKNVPKFSLALVPQDLPRDKEARRKIVERLAFITGQPLEDILKVINEYGSYSYESIIINEDINYDEALLIQIATADLPGLFIQRGSKRLYFPDQATVVFGASSKDELLTSLSHVIGYQGKLDSSEVAELHKQGYLISDYIGKTGVEKEYERILRGVYGKKRIEVDSAGREQSVIAEEPPAPGQHVILAIDKEAQDKLEQIIRHYMSTSGKSRAAGVALDPRNGEILALVSLPAFDNNFFSGGVSRKEYQSLADDPDQPLFNRAISGVYPSGSTIKPAIAAAALEEGVIRADTAVESTGGIEISDWWFPDWLPGGHGRTSVTKALAWSVNTFFYYIGGGYKNFEGLGVEKIMRYLKLFGFGSRLNIDLHGEAAGFLPSKEWKEKTKKEKWYIGDTYNVSIGQGDILVTPLQIAMMTAAIANGGTLFEPKVVRAFQNPTTGEMSEQKTKIIRENFIGDNNLKIVKRGMRECVLGGSCRLLASSPADIAGKTGTAQWSSTKEDHAWFTSFAPYADPEVVVTLLVEEGVGGDKIAVPIANDFYKWWAKNRHVDNGS